MEQAAVQNTGTGMLQFRSYTASEAYPVPDVQVTVQRSDGTTIQLSTGSTALSEAISIPCPPRSLSLSPDNTILPYATCNIHAEKEGYLPVDVKGVQIFDTITSVQPLDMIPAVDQNGAWLVSEPAEDTNIPVHKLFAGGRSSGQSPIEACRARILSTPVIPNKITVHLGRPAASAQNVTVSFRDYIKNVASSEVYPTWPEQALRANIHAQISLALNRVFTTPESVRLSQTILDSYCEATGFENLGVQYYDNMSGINWSTVPVTILEMGFMTNENDDRKMNDPTFQEKMVQGIADGIDAYFS